VICEEKEGRAVAAAWVVVVEEKGKTRANSPFVDRRHEPKRFSRLPQAGNEISTGRDLNDSGEAKEGAHTTELLT
jgi:hypothetical protein